MSTHSQRALASVDRPQPVPCFHVTRCCQKPGRPASSGGGGWCCYLKRTRGWGAEIGRQALSQHLSQLLLLHSSAAQQIATGSRAAPTRCTPSQLICLHLQINWSVNSAKTLIFIFFTKIRLLRASRPVGKCNCCCCCW